MAWCGYELFDPGVDRPLDEVSRTEARAAFDLLMAKRDERIEQLRRLLLQNGMTMSGSDQGLLQLEEWFRSEVEEDPDRPGRLRPVWYSVVNDIALFLGELIIARAPGVRWELCEGGKRNVSYQRPVLRGFRGVTNQRYNVDLDLSIGGFAHGVTTDAEREPGVFLRLVAHAVAKG